MDKQPSRRSSLFLMELIIAILFFSLAATVCVRFFVKSYTLEQDSKNLNHAVTAATSVAEIFHHQEDFMSCLAEEYSLGSSSENCYTFYYDKSWNLCDAQSSVYTVILRAEEHIPFVTGDISVNKDEHTLYELSIKKYSGKEVSFIEN